jgi:hypothetical protein
MPITVFYEDANGNPIYDTPGGRRKVRLAGVRFPDFATMYVFFKVLPTDSEEPATSAPPRAELNLRQRLRSLRPPTRTKA